MSEWWVSYEWVMSDWWMSDEWVLRVRWVSERGLSEWLREWVTVRWVSEAAEGEAAVRWRRCCGRIEVKKKDPTQWWWGNCNKNKKTCKWKTHMEWKRMEMRLLFLKQLCHNKGNIFFILFTNRCILVWRLGTLLHRRDRDTGTCCGCQLCIWDTGKVHQRSFRA